MYSTQPRKNRKARYNAPLHLRGKMVRAHLSKELRTTLKKRSARVRKGDTVKIITGKYRKIEGKVTNVSLNPAGIYVEGAVVKKVGGKELPVLIDASNVVVVQRIDLKTK